MDMKANLATCIAALVSVSAVTAEVVEEETWYSAEGKVVKTVKTLLPDGAPQKGSAGDWEPAWVLRERARESRRTQVHGPARRFWRARTHGWAVYPSYRVYLSPGGYVGDLRSSLSQGYAWPRRQVFHGRPGLILRIAR